MQERELPSHPCVSDDSGIVGVGLGAGLAGEGARATIHLAVTAVQHVRRMRGGAQGHLMRCSDTHFYVVKFRNNPQHLRVLANELLATRLAELAGLPVPATNVVEVDEWLVEHTPELNIQLAGSCIPCQAGLQFGSRYVVSPLEGQVFDYLPIEMLSRVRNLEAFAGMLVIDKWTGNANGRQAAFWRRCETRSTPCLLSIRDIASTRESGRFRTIRCAGFMHGMRFMPGCRVGSHLNRGCRGWKAWKRM